MAKEPEAEIPFVSTLPHEYLSYLRERTLCNQIRDALKQQRLKMKPLEDRMKHILEEQERKRKFFAINPEYKEQFGDCIGLRIGKHTRCEYFSEKRLEEVCSKVMLRLFAYFQPEHARNVNYQKEFIKQVSDGILSERKRNKTFSIEYLKPRKPRKRKHGDEEEEDEE